MVFGFGKKAKEKKAAAAAAKASPTVASASASSGGVQASPPSSKPSTPRHLVSKSTTAAPTSTAAGATKPSTSPPAAFRASAPAYSQSSAPPPPQVTAAPTHIPQRLASNGQPLKPALKNSNRNLSSGNHVVVTPPVSPQGRTLTPSSVVSTPPVHNTTTASTPSPSYRYIGPIDVDEIPKNLPDRAPLPLKAFAAPLPTPPLTTTTTAAPSPPSPALKTKQAPAPAVVTPPTAVKPKVPAAVVTPTASTNNTKNAAAPANKPPLSPAKPTKSKTATPPATATASKPKRLAVDITPEQLAPPPKSALKKTSSNRAKAAEDTGSLSKLLVIEQHQSTNNSISKYSMMSKNDDMSLVSFDNISVMSRISVHIDAFLAEMAMADNEQLEQLALQEMKHKRILPQKIKKLNAKISVLQEEREVLLGLMDQLKELVQNDSEKKRKEKQERKRKKKELKQQQKKQQAATKKSLPSPPASPQKPQEVATVSPTSARTQGDGGADSSPRTPGHASNSSIPTSPTTMASPPVASKSDEQISSKIQDLQQLLLQDVEYTDQEDEDSDDITDHNHTATRIRHDLWGDDPSEVALPHGQLESVLGGGPGDMDTDTEEDKPRGGRGHHDDDDEDEDDDDEFAKLWNSSYRSDDSASDKDKNHHLSDGEEDVPATKSVDDAVPEVLMGEDKQEDKQEDKVKKKESPSRPERPSVQTLEIEEVDMGDGDEEEEEKELEVKAPNTTAEEDYYFDDEQLRLSLPSNLAVSSARQGTAAHQSITSDGTDVVSNTAAASVPPPAATSSTMATSSSGAAVTDEAATASGQARMSKRAGRFSTFNEAETYLPEHMPGSRGNSPSRKKKGKHHGEDGAVSDDDSDSDDDSSTSSASTSSEGPAAILEDDDEEEDAKPSTSHVMAKQLMARLNQQQAKQQEQEQLQKQLFDIHRNSTRRLLLPGDVAMAGLNSGPTSSAHSSSQYNAVYTNSTTTTTTTTTNISFAARGSHRPALSTALSTSALLDPQQPQPHSTGTTSEIVPSTGNNKAYVNVVDEVVELRKELYASVQELDQLKEERKFHEQKVQELLAVLERRFDTVDDDDDDEDDDVAQAEEEAIRKAMKDEDNKKRQAAGGSEEEDPTTDQAKKRRKRMQSFLLQKVSECAELAATVEVLKDQVSQKQTKIEELTMDLSDSPANATLHTIPSEDAQDKENEEASNRIAPSAPDIPKAAPLVESISSNLTKDKIEKQLLEKSAECIDLQEQIKQLQDQLEEKDGIYQEVHRELFTANLALGVEVDRKAVAQEALDEKTQELETIKKENEELKAHVDKLEDRCDALNGELFSRGSTMDEIDLKHKQELRVLQLEIQDKEVQLKEMTKHLRERQLRVDELEEHHENVREKEAAHEKIVNELKAVLVEESDQREELQKRVAEVEKEKEEFMVQLEYAKRENEITKNLISKNEDNEAGGGGPAVDGARLRKIKEEVEKLMAQNAELARDLKASKESEESLLSERERLVANATNMSITLADSRAKVDFLQMQLEEYKSPLSVSDHGMTTHSEHGFSPHKRLAANFISSVTSASSTGGGAMMDGSERSFSGMSSSTRDRSTRFRNFLRKRSGADSAAGD
jgi:DNA repair exonuclease SbcCD ATPase subunit